MSKVPEPWATRMVDRGFTDRRSTKSSIASYGAVADQLGLHTSTVSDAITGRRRPDPTTVALLMEALGDDVPEWLGFKHHGPWEPPSEIAFLGPRQRNALEELIRAIANGEEGEHGGDTAATKTPPSGGGSVTKLTPRQTGRTPRKAAARKMGSDPKGDPKHLD